MPSSPQEDQIEPVIIRLQAGTTAVIIVVHSILVILQILFAAWIAMTPGRDRDLKTVSSRSDRYHGPGAGD
ncbi:MAG: hypothetical protein JWL77_6330 [Chthonomonadaceae bacterium]|nr:hypothetical protein [Chthonomonadaceae bacterium]